MSSDNNVKKAITLRPFSGSNEGFFLSSAWANRDFLRREPRRVDSKISFCVFSFEFSS